MNDILLTLMNAGNTILAFLEHQSGWNYLVVALSLFFSFVLAWSKSFILRKWDKQPSEVKMFLTNFGTIVMMAVVAYLQSTPEQDPYVAIFGLAGITTAIQQPFFYKVVKPAITMFWETWDRGKQLNDELKTAAVPESGLPIE